MHTLCLVEDLPEGMYYVSREVSVVGFCKCSEFVIIKIKQ